MNLRIQTYGRSYYARLWPHEVFKLTITDDVNVQDVLEKGLNDLMDLCDVVLDKFVEARDHAKVHGTVDEESTKI